MEGKGQWDGDCDGVGVLDYGRPSISGSIRSIKMYNARGIGV